MDYQNLVRDFAMRTLRNLEAIEAAVEKDRDAELYEVTQLINSMLGLLVFPQQRFFRNVPRIPISQLRAEGWPIPVMSGTPPRVENLQDLMICLRNGIAHCNVDFTTDGHTLTGIRIWNYPFGSKTRDWEAEFRIHELRETARRFIALLLENDK